MASLSLCPQFETNLMSNCKVVELLLQLKSAKAHGKIYKKVKPHLLRHLCVTRCTIKVLLGAGRGNSERCLNWDGH